MFPSIRNSIIKWYISGGDVLMFVAYWLAISLFVGQDRTVVKGDIGYWMALAPAIIFPFVRLRETLSNLLNGTARPIAVFGIASILWLIVRGDFAMIAPVLLFM